MNGLEKPRRIRTTLRIGEPKRVGNQILTVTRGNGAQVVRVTAVPVAEIDVDTLTQSPNNRSVNTPPQ